MACGRPGAPAEAPSQPHSLPLDAARFARRWLGGGGEADGLLLLQHAVDGVRSGAVDLDLVENVKLKAKLPPCPLPLLLGGAWRLPSKLQRAAVQTI